MQKIDNLTELIKVFKAYGRDIEYKPPTPGLKEATEQEKLTKLRRIFLQLTDNLINYYDKIDNAKKANVFLKLVDEFANMHHILSDENDHPRSSKDYC